ncbi:MAG TPA: phosphoribosyltransferase family protein, partial [Pyrinomonadaceae bacterium]
RAMRFVDARGAGGALAAALESYGGRADALVLALARGGAGVGLEVSKRLGLALDLVLLRRLFVTRGPLEPSCAVSLAGSLFIDELDAPPGDPAFGHFLEGALAELEAGARACRGGRPALDLRGRTVLLVDNGVRTGSTMLAAVRALRPRSPARIFAAAPVADAAALDGLSDAADEVVCLATPEPFGHVGLWYADFRRPHDAEIRALLDETINDERRTAN